LLLIEKQITRTLGGISLTHDPTRILFPERHAE